jgi:predicted transporter
MTHLQFLICAWMIIWPLVFIRAITLNPHSTPKDDFIASTILTAVLIFCAFGVRLACKWTGFL